MGFLGAVLPLPAILAASITPGQIAKLPDWAAAAAREVVAETPPAEADAWVLVQRTDVAYLGEGKVRVHERRLVWVLSERGLDERFLRVTELSGKGCKLKRLKAWNARPTGDLEDLDRSDALALDDGMLKVLTAQFARAMKGSLLAYEVLAETEHPMGPTEVLGVMEDCAVRRWALEARSEKPGVDVTLDRRHLSPWARTVGPESPTTLVLQDIPARPDPEPAAPHERNVFPWVHVVFRDPALQKDVPGGASWDTLASWVQAKYAAQTSPTRLTSAGASDPASSLRTIHDWISRQLTYRQVYLTPDRGWVPSPAADVARRQYGDCKDLATFFISEARAAGLQAYPVLARIVEGQIEEDEPPNVFAFNHAIAAIRLPATLGLPAEVETSEGRFLLVDPTDRFAAFGRLSDVHAGRRLLICLEKAGVWVTVPETAVSSGHPRFSLEGELTTANKFTGTLRVETYSRLRSTDVQGGEEALRKFCLGLLPPDARCDVKTHSQALDLATPYEVTFGLDYNWPPDSSGARGWTIRPPGFPAEPAPLQRPGQIRQLPVAVDDRSSLEYSIHVKIPWLLTPVAPAGEGKTSFRTYSWTAAVRGDPSAAEIEFHFSQQRIPQTFAFDRREEGVAAWKADRALVRRVKEEALAFRAP